MNAKQTNIVKIGLAIVLAVVFMVVLGNSVMTIQRTSSSPPMPPPPRHARAVATQPAAAPAAVAVPEASRESEKTASDKRAWPVFELAEIIDYDPFGIAKSQGAAAANSGAPGAGVGKEAGPNTAAETIAGAKEPESRIKERIHAVYQRGGRTTALIGSKTLQAGDNIEGAGRIVEMDQGGVTLEVKK